MDYPLETLLYGKQFRRLMEKKLEPFEVQYHLSKIDLQILFYLYTSGEKNTSKDIMGLKLFTRGHISQSLGRLQKMGYVEMEQDAVDRRCVHNYLTREADPIMFQLGAIFEEIQEIVMQGVTRSEREVLETVVRKINQNISDVLEE